MLRGRVFARTHRRALIIVRTFVAIALIVGGVVVGSEAAFAATPTWPSGQYMGVLQNVPFTIPIAITAGAPLTAMTVNTAPSNVTGFGLTHINLTTGTADMVGTYTAAANGSTTTASIKATNASGNANGSFTLEAYTCSWNSGGSPASTTTVFDVNQSEYVTGTQTAFGAPITGGVTAGSSTLLPTCADIHVPGLGASTLTLSNPFSGTITPQNNDNDSAESDMNVGCGIVSILGTNTGSYSGSNCNGSRTVPAAWANGGTLSLSIGSQSDKGDTNTALTNCPPSQAAVNAGLISCTITGSSGSSSYSWNYSSDQFLYNNQAVPQTSTATLNTSSVIQGHAVSVTGGTNWWGNAAGAPVTGTGHTQSGSYYSVPAPGVFIGTTRATAVAATNSTVAISPVSYACGQASSTVAPNPCTFTAPNISGTFTVPASLAPGLYNVYIDEPNTTPLMGNGPNDSYQTARGTNRGTAEAVTTLNVVAPPSITSAASATGVESIPFSFTVTTSSLVATMTKTGTLPNGLTFVYNGDGTATISGTPQTGSNGVYAITLNADSGLGVIAHQSFLLTINVEPSITSQPSLTVSENSPFTFTVTSDGIPTSSLSEAGALPSGVTFVDNHDSTATLAGAPAVGTHGSYPITITASNGNGVPAQQNFTLIVDLAPSIISAGSATATEGSAFNFTVTATGAPTPALSLGGALPGGLSFHDNHDGTATISGSPVTGSQGIYGVTFTANNGVGSPAQQLFGLTVDAAPTITSAASTASTEGNAFSFNVTTTGLPLPTLTADGTLPSGVTFVDNGDGTATLAGTPDVGTNGDYPLTITADNGIGTPAQQNFTLAIEVGAAITSANSATTAAAAPFTFGVTTTGFPAPSIGETGTLPAGVTFVDNGDGTATLSGTPTNASIGTYSLAITADNGVGDPAVQSFTLTVDPVVSTGQATVSISEGDNPIGKTLNIPVTLSASSSQPVTVHYQTNDGPGAHSADAGSDYVAWSGTLTIPAGMTSKNVQVTIIGDTTVENDETFTLTISSPTNAILGSQLSTLATITNDDHAKWQFVAPGVVEGNHGITATTVTINMSLPSAVPVSVNWSTADATAKSNSNYHDYVAASGVLTFAPGQTSKVVTVNVRGDTLPEDTEYFKVMVNNVTTSVPGGISASGSVAVQIYNDDLPRLLVNSHTGAEGALFLFKATLQFRYYHDISICYATADGTATAASGDYTPVAGCVTIPAGVRAVAMPPVTALYDFTSEPKETFQMWVAGQSDPLGLKIGIGTISANNT